MGTELTLRTESSGEQVTRKIERTLLRYSWIMKESVPEVILTSVNQFDGHDLPV